MRDVIWSSLIYLQAKTGRLEEVEPNHELETDPIHIRECCPVLHFVKHLVLIKR
jgi:hypothetical protein